MTHVRKPFAVGALAVVAAGCSEPSGSRLGRHVDSVVGGAEHRLEASDSAEYDQFGWSVSLAGNRALVGAYGDGLYRGAAYVFVRSGSSWIEEQKLVASDGAEGDSFGGSVSLAGDRALVGAYAGDAYRGAAYVFVRSAGSWTLERKLVASDGAEGDNFGGSVSLAGDRALVGAYGDDVARGAAYVFVRSGSSWTEEQKLIASDGAVDDHLGYAVSLDVDRALVGAQGDDTDRGAAYLFARSGASWTEEQKLVASDGSGSDHFGTSVSLGPDRALIAAYWDDSLRGAAYTFVRSDGSWTEEQKLVASDGAGGERFGNSISLAADRALIGAFAHDARGAAYDLVRDGSAWTEEQKLVASDGANGDLFGWSVSLGEDNALVGAPSDDNLRGAAYVFSLAQTNGEACSADEDCLEERYCAADKICQPKMLEGGVDPPMTSSEPSPDRGESVPPSEVNPAGGGFGCTCRAVGSPGPVPCTWLGVALVMLLCWRRRSAIDRPPGPTLPRAAIARGQR